jgi:hypothetical protein
LAGEGIAMSRSKCGVLVCFGLAVLLLGFWIYLVLGVLEVWSAAGLVGIALGTVLYLLLGYTVHPKPTTLSAVSWAGCSTIRFGTRMTSTGS